MTEEIDDRGSAQPKSTRVVAIIPRGEVIRNFVYSGALDEVAANAEISLLAVSTGSDLDKMLVERFGIIHNLREYEERWFVRFQRDILDVAHGKWLWSRAAQERWRLRDREARTLRQKAIRFVKKTVGSLFASRLGLRLLEKGERLSSHVLKTTSHYTRLYQELKPDLVFNGSHIHSRNAIQAVQSAQWLGIPTATFIFSWDNLTSQGRITLPYDYFFVWNESLKNQLLEMYDWIKPEAVFITGTPQFDFHFRTEFYLSREEYCHQIGADSGRPIIFYATGMPNHMPGEPEIVEAIADMLNEYDEGVRPQLLVRVYAKDRSGRFDSLRSRRDDILFPTAEWEEAWLTPKYEDSYALVNTLRHSALGINVASTLSLELCMFDKPVINVGYNPKSIGTTVLKYADYYDFDHYRPVVDSGAVQVAKSEYEMGGMIRGCLAKPADRREERRRLVDYMFGSMLDGNSGQRVAQLLLQLSKISVKDLARK